MLRLVSGQPDQKSGRRIVDGDALARARLREDECGACGRGGANAHHVLPKGSPHFGDDVLENLIVMCGTGTTGCHGALHGSPYTDRAGRRWTGEDVRMALGRTFARRRPDVIRYVLGKLGAVHGTVYLTGRYGLSPDEIDAALPGPCVCGERPVLRDGYYICVNGSCDGYGQICCAA